MTPYEILFIILSNMGFPDDLLGYPVNYYRSFGEADIVVPDNMTIEKKITIMRDFIQEHYKIMFENIYIDDNIKHYEVEKVLTLFNMDEVNNGR